MTLSELLDSFSEQALKFENSTVLWIKGGSIAPLFCSLLTDRITELYKVTSHSVQARGHTEQNLQAFLGMAFLGESQWYILKDASELATVQQKRLFTYLATYNGPHHIICVVDEQCDLPPQAAVIDLTGDITRHTFAKLCFFIHGAQVQDPLFVKQLFDSCKSLSLDTAYTLSHYAQFLGRRHEGFFKDWFERIVEPEHSLFMLSQFFFAKDIKQFLALWSKISRSYPDEFWVSYWLEQIWQASLFVHSTRSRDTSTKKYITRLPFSFTQKDWKQYALPELTRAHSFLYKVDHGMKNSAASCGVDVFCLKFMSRQFSIA
jgi:hypothetical protein